MQPDKLRNSISSVLKLDPTLESEIAILPFADVPSGRVVYAPTGRLDVDYDDVRSLRETAIKGIRRALKAGIKRPLVALQENKNFLNSELVTLLGILEGLYVVSRNIIVMLEKVCHYNNHKLTFKNI